MDRRWVCCRYNPSQSTQHMSSSRQNATQKVLLSPKHQRSSNHNIDSCKNINSMGCCPSSRPQLAQAEDSVHVMIVQDQQHRRGTKEQEQVQYRPREPHPLMDSTRTDDDDTKNDTHNKKDPTGNQNKDHSTDDTATPLPKPPPPQKQESSSSILMMNDTNKLLYHTAHHNDTIDSKDLELVAGTQN